ncbi:bifunctional 4-hydroxy-2-oxoglutarate aldolase/2-dehydro-3-deoxy-phosphogluconate aldolase [Microbacterium sp. BK668]|uniref:bifunctional 4-hydroxy-2-oxoglutarate aldolase/2-dehydro-3-deoxy-phosphogluconate aldolase n=1 Tax=Microbacterium sp. BK668 TaxID=2512118 RepID=UPI00106082FF|nr:bifunctional 4-hydroxy-2-oxoglutarate aldolase/2-dehydro-3-deoxy-phosphogluconate aldolase [Microbacterium sp. BK668]TDN91566.1 2-keto-3-deoxy-phosphogluconate aldolase [Microbacterium sp. BK668]
MTGNERDSVEEALLETLTRSRVLPLLDVRGRAGVDRVAEVLVEEGLPVIEVTLRRPGAADALRALADNHELLVGAGTVMTARQAGEAVEAGARFLVSPGHSPAVAAEAARLSVPLIPGVATATELMAALDDGARTVKFFPAEASGGPAAIRALSAVAPDVRWVPTGGVTPANAREYLDIDVVAAVGGSWVTPRALVEEGCFDAIAELVRGAVGLRA